MRKEYHTLMRIQLLVGLLLFSSAVFAIETTQEITNPVAPRWQLIPQASVISPSTISIVEAPYEIPYDEILKGFPAIFMSLATPFKEFGPIQTYWMIRAGFSYKAGNYTLPSSVLNRSTDSNLNLMWVPLSGGMKFEYTHTDFQLLKPALILGAGTEFIHQNSSTESLNKSVWLPYYSISAQLGFHTEGAEVLDGFNFGVTFSDSFAVKEKVRAWSFDLSLNFLL